MSYEHHTHEHSWLGCNGRRRDFSVPVSAHEIVIGAAVSTTGKYAVNGKHTTNGYNLAVAKVNAMGGIIIDGK